MSAKKYEKDYKMQSVKLALEVVQSKAAKELGISKNITPAIKNTRN